MGSNHSVISLKRTVILLAAMVFTLLLMAFNLSWLFGQEAGAAQVTTRSLQLSSTLDGTQTTGAANSETNGSDTTHTFTFDPATTGSVLSAEFEYCTTAIGTCTAPTGLNVVTGTTITIQTSEGTTFSNLYSIDGAGQNNCLAAANRICITNATGNTFTAGTGGTIVFAFDDILNPSTLGTFFVRMMTYSDSAWTTTRDDGTVASSITTGITITSRVAETLGFSTTANLAGSAAEGTTCVALATAGAITLGDALNGALSISQTYDAFSGFRLNTNSANGTLVQYRGNTLTKGTDNIDAIPPPAVVSNVGSEQFGLAIDQDGVAALAGSDGGFGGVGQLDLLDDYNEGEGAITEPGGVAEFAFVANTLTTIAESTPPGGSGYVDCDTAAVRYIGNISPLTPAGTYTTTIVYYAVPTY